MIGIAGYSLLLADGTLDPSTVADGRAEEVLKQTMLYMRSAGYNCKVSICPTSPVVHQCLLAFAHQSVDRPSDDANTFLHKLPISVADMLHNPTLELVGMESQHGFA